MEPSAPSVYVEESLPSGGRQDEACARPWTHVATEKGIHLFEFPNKLRTVLVPRETNNVCSFSIVYLVGSNQESSSEYGSVHVLEHLMFKGSRKFHKQSKRGDIWHALGNRGVRGINASTSKQRTEYHEEELPVELLDTAIELEADRMVDPLLDDEAANGERIVVLNEYQRQRNSRTSLLRQKVFMVSFDNGSSGKAVIGTKTTICRIIEHMDELRAFQKDNYVPANAVIVITGAFEPERVLRKIHACFKDIPSGLCSRDRQGHGNLEEDEPQLGAKAVDIAGPMPVGILGFRTGIVANSREALCLELLQSWINMGVAGPFHDMLKDPSLHDVEADYQRTYGATLFNVWIIPVSGGDTASRTERWLGAVLQCLVGHKASPLSVLSNEQLRDLKSSLQKCWHRQIETCGGMNAQIVESLSRCNSPFDVTRRHEILAALSLEDMSRTARSVFVTHRMTVGKIVPELGKLPCEHPPVTEYSVNGSAPTPCRKAGIKRFPFERATVTPTGVYVADKTAPNVSVRIHIPTPTTSNAKAELQAALATAGVTLEDGSVLAEKDVHELFHSSGASASVDGSHSGINISLEMPARSKDFRRLVSILGAGLSSPTISDSDFTRKKNYLSEQVVGSDFNVNETARRAYNRCLFHSASDPRRMQLGAQEGATIRGLDRSSTLEGLRRAGKMGAYVTAVAPDVQHLQVIQSAFENGKAPVMASAVPPFPTVSPMAGRVVYKKIPGKTSATMLYGCAVPIGPAHELALPLSLAVSALGGSFSSRLMQIVRDENSLSYGLSASQKLMDPGCTTVTVMGTFGEDLMDRGVACTKDVVHHWRAEGITEEELEIEKTRALESVRFTWNSPSRSADALHACRMYFDDPRARALSLPDRLRAVTMEDCRRAVTELLPPMEDWCCVVAGAVSSNHA